MFFKTSDDELMARVAKGDQNAFRSLFDRHGARMLGYCRRVMGDTVRGEDMAQAAWMKVIKSAPSYRGEKKFMSWLLTLARNVCLSELRLASERLELPTLEVNETADVEAFASRAEYEKDLERQHSIDDLKKKIEDLPEAQRIVLTLWMSEEHSYEQIALELKITEASVKSLLFRARRSLEKAMRAAYEVV